MKDNLLLLMTPSMSLEKWNERGQLSREISYYKDLCKQANLRLTIYSYGRNDIKFINKSLDITVLGMPHWIPQTIPFRLQNLIYNITSLFFYRRFFKRAVICKTNQFSAYGFGILLKMIYKMPLVTRMGYYYSHFMGLSFSRNLEERLAFKVSDLILTTSPEAAGFIEKKYSITSAKILTMCNSIDLNKFKRIDLQKEYDLIFVGKLEVQKNIELLLEVVSSLNLKTLIIGKGSLDLKVKQAISKHKHIIWKERVDNMELPVYYNKSKCFLLLSEHEGNPKVLLEAMACGLPCIVTNVPGIRECIEHQVNGIFVDKNMEDIQQRIKEICGDEMKAKSIGENALQWVKINSSYTENIKREANFYLEVI